MIHTLMRALRTLLLRALKMFFNKEINKWWPSSLTRARVTVHLRNPTAQWKQVRCDSIFPSYDGRAQHRHAGFGTRHISWSILQKTQLWFRRSLRVHVGTRKMVNYAWAGWSQRKLWWRIVALLTCNSIVWLGYRGERLIEPSSSCFVHI